IPSLAKSWNTENGKEWIFYLRDDVMFVKDTCFSNNVERKLTAKDVKYTFERLLNKDSKSLGISYFSNIVGFNEYRNGESKQLNGIIVKDKHTLIFKLKDIDFNFPNLLSLPYCSIVKENAINSYDPKLHPVGTGPFFLKEYKANESICFVKNNEYWEKINSQSIPVIDGVEINLTTDDNYSFLLFKNEKSDFLELNIPLLKQLENTKIPFKYEKDVFELTQLNFYLFNLKKINDPNIRKGINYAINRFSFQEILGENGTVTRTLYPKIFPNILKPNKLLQYEPDKAKEFLNKPMELKLVAFDDILSRSLVKKIANDLDKYSIKVTIEAVPFPVLVDRLTSGNYDMIQLYWGLLYADVNNFLTPFKTSSLPPAGNNFNKYSNPEFDKLVKKASETSINQQAEIYLKAEEVILNDMPFYLAYYANTIRVSNKKYKMPLNPLGYKFYKNAVPVE
ncbi:MAG: ABC transporter substrate-binding protein, partial [Bacteroidales bacterium]|nr:ABC transporter substrate-binding protein [Bacteroidales bacterium]